MDNFIRDFRAALSFALKKTPQKQGVIAMECNITPQYLTHIKKGNKDGSEEVRRSLATALGYTYEGILDLGRWINSGKDGEDWPGTTTGIGMLEVSAIENIAAQLTNSENVSHGFQITRRVPLISSVQAGSWTEVVDNFQPGDAEEWIDVTSRVDPSAFALVVVGNSMEAEFREGEIVIVDPGREARSGDYVVAKINDDEATFKQLIVDGGNVYLRPLNSDYPVIVVPKDKTFMIVGRIVEKVKKY